MFTVQLKKKSDGKIIAMPTCDAYNKQDYKWDPVQKKVVYIKKGKAKNGEKDFKEVLSEASDIVKKINEMEKKIPNFKYSGRDAESGNKYYHTEFKVGKDKYELEFSDWGGNKSEAEYIYKNGKDLYECMNVGDGSEYWASKPTQIDKIVKEAMYKKIDKKYKKKPGSKRITGRFIENGRHKTK